MLARAFACVLTVVLLGCGGSTRNPSPASPSPIAPLRSGSYYLSVAQGTEGGITDPSTGFTSCIGAGGAWPQSVWVPVVLDGSGNTFVARAASGTLVLKLTVADPSVAGELSGSASDSKGYSLEVKEATVTFGGLLTGDRTVRGTVLGAQIILKGPNGSGACSPAIWQLAPQ